MIHRLSYSIANWLGKQAQGHSVAVLAYGIEIFLIAVIQLILILLVALLLGLFAPVIAVLLSFTFLRIFSGGKHLSTFWSCTLSDIIIINGLAWLAHKAAITASSIHIPALVALLIATWVSVDRYAPLITVSRPTSWVQSNGRAISKIIIIITAIGAAITYLFAPVISIALVLGVAAQAVSITPGGCKALDRLDRWLSSK